MPSDIPPSTSFRATLHYDFRKGRQLDPVLAANALIGYSHLLDAAHVILRQTHPALEGTKLVQDFVDLEEGSLTGKIIVGVSGIRLGDMFTKVDGSGEPQLRGERVFATTVGALVLSSCLSYNRSPDTSETLGGEALQEEMEEELRELHKQEDADDKDLKRLKSLLSEPFKLSGDVGKILAPAREMSSGVAFDYNRSTFIPSRIAYGLPAPRDAPEYHEFDDVVEEAKISIRASDLDKRRGWSAKIPSVSDERLKLKIDKAIIPQNLAGVTQMIGRVRVTYKVDYNGAHVPVHYELLSAVAERDPTPRSSAAVDRLTSETSLDETQ